MLGSDDNYIIQKDSDFHYTILNETETEIVDAKKPQATKQSDVDDDTESNSLSNLTEEEIENMDTEELIAMFRKEWDTAIFNNEDCNHVTSNAIFFELVNKMSDEKLDEFMKMYQEEFPTTRREDGTYIFSSYERLLSGFMWGSYSVAAGSIDKEDALSALERLKKYCPQLNMCDGNGIKQWA